MKTVLRQQQRRGKARLRCPFRSVGLRRNTLGKVCHFRAQIGALWLRHPFKLLLLYVAAGVQRLRYSI